MKTLNPIIHLSKLKINTIPLYIMVNRPNVHSKHRKHNYFICHFCVYSAFGRESCQHKKKARFLLFFVRNICKLDFGFTGWKQVKRKKPKKYSINSTDCIIYIVQSQRMLLPHCAYLVATFHYPHISQCNAILF